MPIPYTLVVSDEENANLSAYADGAMHLIHSTHPYWDRIVLGLTSTPQDEGVLDLFDVVTTATRKFENLSERVTTSYGKLYLDGDEVNDALAKQIIRFLDAGEEFDPLVQFLEHVSANPNDHSREMLWSWLDAHDFTIDEEGHIVGYKGVESDGSGGYQSLSSGTAIVDGQEVTGRIPNRVGSTVEMPRSEVAHDPHNACSTGLHVGTYPYAQSWARGGVTLRVSVNPRDVVSVPRDAAGKKVRVCRYRVEEIIEAAVPTPLVRSAPFDRERGDDPKRLADRYVLEEAYAEFEDVTFDYQGEERTLQLEDLSDTHVSGYDFGRRAYRQFIISKITPGSLRQA